MRQALSRVAALIGICAIVGACGGNKDNFQASVDSMNLHRDSTIRALDSSKTGAAVGKQVDTTKLGAAKTESILTKARKSP